MIRILTVCAARPNFMKVAPLIKAIGKHNELCDADAQIKHVLVHTGQHYDSNMSDSFFAELDMPQPDYSLGVGSGTHAYQTGMTMIEFEKVLGQEKPDWVAVVGDVNATMACAITAKKCFLKVAHIEAGLRSGDLTMPEEINRIVTDRVSDLLLTPCRFADEHLKKEGIAGDKVVRVGNIMIDTLEASLEKAGKISVESVIRNHAVGPVPQGVLSKVSEKGFVLLTLHRPANVDHRETLTALMELLFEIGEDWPVIFPVHPRTEKHLRAFHLAERMKAHSGILQLKPVGYLEMLRMTQGARVILTDSGGLQEEACVLNRPCLTLRPNTERPITLVENGGTSRLVGADVEKIRTAFSEALRASKTKKRPELWDGHTAERIVEALVRRSFRTKDG